MNRRRRKYDEEMTRLRPFLWLLWIALIVSPLIFIGLQYDWNVGLWTAVVRSDRLHFLAHDVPQWLRHHVGDLCFAVLAVAICIVVVRLWRLPAWGRFRTDVEMRSRSPLRSVLVMVAIIVALVFSCRYLTDIHIEWAVMAGTYIVLAMGLNLTVGMTGQLVLGYAGLMAVGAYVFAVMHQQWGVSLWVAFLPAAGAGAAVGFLLGLPSMRLRGDYLAIVTLGFGETVRFLIKNLIGEQSIIIARDARVPSLMSEHAAWRWLFPEGLSRLKVELWVVAVMVALSMWLVRNLVCSRIGRALIAIREDEPAAAAMGIPTVRLKLIAFTLSAVWAAVAGVFFVAHNTSANPEMFGFGESVLIVSMVVLGGMGSGPGPIVGALVLYLLPEVLRERFPALISYRPMLVGAMMVAMMVYRPQGLMGSLRRKIELNPEPAT